MTYTNATHLGNAHQEWLRALDFYEKELDILKGRLAEVTVKNTSMDSRAGSEHFQNQFIVQQNNIDEMKHAINQHAHLVFKDAKDHVGRVEEARIDEHHKIEADVASFEKVIKELRKEFNLFVTKWI
jgi:hypothetical protein